LRIAGDPRLLGVVVGADIVSYYGVLFTQLFRILSSKREPERPALLLAATV
jgi:hypothetical protein